MSVSVGDHARDVIAQVYFGQTGDDETRTIARARIDWLAENAHGPKVLDIGCSEGVLVLLLARRGLRVTGIDRHEGAAAYAHEMLEKEPEDVRDRAELITADVFSHELPAGEFDSVVLGEIIEHLEDPGALIAIARRCLRPSGRLIITTPFGYFPDPDHQQSFRLSDFTSLVREHVEPSELSVVDGYIRFVGTAETPTGKAWSRMASPRKLLQITEDALIDLQKVYRSRLATQVAARKELNETVNRWKNQVDQLTATRQQLLSDSSRWKTEVAELTAKREQLLQDVSRWRGRAEELSAKREQLLADVSRCQKQAEQLRHAKRQRDDALRDASHLRAQVDGLITERSRLLDELQVLSQKRTSLLADVGRWQAEAKRIADRRKQTLADLHRINERYSHQQHELARSVARRDELTHEIEGLYRSARYQIGDVLVSAGPPRWELLRVPSNLWRIYRGTAAAKRERASK